MLVVNLFGRPGAGKSTMAADIFAILKRRGVEAELCMEYAKTLVWSDRLNALRDSVYLLAKQNSILRYPKVHGVEVAVTDSPLPIISVYRPADYFPSFDGLLREIYNAYENLNFYVSAEHRYSKVGRLQTEDESLLVGEKIFDLIKAWEIPYTLVAANASTPNLIADRVIEYLEKKTPGRRHDSAGTKG